MWSNEWEDSSIDIVREGLDCGVSVNHLRGNDMGLLSHLVSGRDG